MRTMMKLVTCVVLISIGFVSSWNHDNPDKDWCQIAPVCCEGRRQSPINIQTANLTLPKNFINLFFKRDYFEAGKLKGKYSNDGHSIKFTPSRWEKSRIVHLISKEKNIKARLAQFHFHWGANDSYGSEHAYDGKFFPLELHFVHLNQKYDETNDHLDHGDGAIVVGFMFKPAKENPDTCVTSAPGNAFFTSLMASIGQIGKKGDKGDEVKVDIESLFDAVPDLSTNMAHYEGSLTTPPCSEAVQWFNVMTPVEVSPFILDAIRTMTKDGRGLVLFDNYRPLQALNRRTVYDLFY